MYFSGLGATPPAACVSLATTVDEVERMNASLKARLDYSKSCAPATAGLYGYGGFGGYGAAERPPLPTDQGGCATMLTQMNMVKRAMPDAIAKLNDDIKKRGCAPFPEPASAAAAEPPRGAIGTALHAWRYVAPISALACAYHGYKRNSSIGWALWWGLVGSIPITPVIALAQGFSKPRAGLTPNRSRRGRRRRR